MNFGKVTYTVTDFLFFRIREALANTGLEMASIQADIVLGELLLEMFADGAHGRRCLAVVPLGFLREKLKGNN